MKVDQKDVKSERSVPIKVNAKIELTMKKIQELFGVSNSKSVINSIYLAIIFFSALWTPTKHFEVLWNIYYKKSILLLIFIFLMNEKMRLNKG